MRNAILFVLAGVLLGVVGSYVFLPMQAADVGSGDSAEKKPLYWVAPMDPNYRRDKPGKSPMGMDLVPVYEEGGASSAPGTVTISPEVINNLGVRTAMVETRVLASEINTVGYVHYNEEKLVHIHPRVEGWVERLFVDTAGASINAGDALYSIYSPTLVNAQEEMLLALERGNANLIRAAEDRLKSLQLSDQVLRDLKRDRKVQQRITVYSPQSGVIDNLNIREGFYVQPQTTLMSIGALDDVWVEAELFERQAALVNEGDEVLMTLDYLPGRNWTGQVEYIYPILNPTTRTVRVRLRFANDNRFLKPNMFAQITIFGRDDEAVTAVPTEAVIRTGQMNRVVMALGAGQFRSIEVETGRTDGAFTEILAGLNPGETVVSSAQFLLDSESSKTSDFRRLDAGMDHSGMDHSGMDHSSMDHSQHEMEEPDSVAVVDGVINSISVTDRVLNISRGPIIKWNRGPMTMDFLADDSLDLEALPMDREIRFEFEIRDGEFVFTRLLDDQEEG